MVLSPQPRVAAEASSLSLEMAPEADELLQDVARRVHGDESDAIRLGLGLLKLALDTFERGEKVAILDKDGAVKAAYSKL